MSFTSIGFYLALVPTLGAFVHFRQHRLLILLAFSLFFFSQLSGLPYFLLFFILVSLNYLMAKKPLWINLVLNFSVLIFFKLKIAILYFTEDHAFNHTGVAGILLPVGLSFYTFQLVAYQIDSARERTRESFPEFLLFISFFPQLVAGPIERKSELLPQIKELSGRPWAFDPDSVLLIAWGLFKKLVVAERASFLCSILFAPGAKLSGAEAFLAAIIFGVQIYCDFSGYTNIALGLGKLFNIKIRENFLSPYTSPSLSQFWRRWHVTLSEWFRDYIYLPLGRTKTALLLVFLLSGIWHGSTPMFLSWGLYHGTLVLLQRSWPGRKFPGPAGVILTFMTVSLGWIIFRSDSFSHAGEIFRVLFTPAADWIQLPNLRKLPDVLEGVIFVAGSVLVIVIDHLRFCRKQTLAGYFHVVSFFLLLLAVMFLTYPQSKTFIYFHF